MLAAEKPIPNTPINSPRNNNTTPKGEYVIQGLGNESLARKVATVRPCTGHEKELAQRTDILAEDWA